MKTILTVSALAVLLISGCASAEQRAEKHHNDLLATFPPAKTTRADVLQHFNYSEAEVSEFRPRAGWEKCRNSEVGQLCIMQERKLGKRINRCERYSSANLFSVAFLWFYYDAGDRLLDVESQKTKED